MYNEISNPTSSSAGKNVSHCFNDKPSRAFGLRMHAIRVTST